MTDPDEGISQSTIDWVEGYVPAQIGSGRYIAHIMIGFATLEDLKVIEAEPFDALVAHPASVPSTTSASWEPLARNSGSGH